MTLARRGTQQRCLPGWRAGCLACHRLCCLSSKRSELGCQLLPVCPLRLLCLLRLLTFLLCPLSGRAQHPAVCRVRGLGVGPSQVRQCWRVVCGAGEEGGR